MSVPQVMMHKFVQNLIRDHENNNNNNNGDGGHPASVPTTSNSFEFVLVSDNARVFADAAPKAVRLWKQLSANEELLGN